MKKILTLFLTGIMVISMVACSGETQNNDDVSGVGTTDSQPVDEVVENSYNPAKLSNFGLPEPSFTYSLSHYHEVTIGGDENGNAILRPRFFYDFDCDLETIYNYMKELKNAGLDAYLPEELPELSDDDWLNYETKNDNIRFFISWHTKGTHRMYLTDKTRTCSWDDNENIYTIDDAAGFDCSSNFSYDEE